MDKAKKPVVVVIAEDDDDDYLIAEKAFESAKFNGTLCRVKDGIELMNMLLAKESADNVEEKAMIILLDLNMPCKDGREALREIKAHPSLKRLPVIVMTTSHVEEDVIRSYELGANSFVRKPFNFQDFVKMAAVFRDYWFNIAELPRKGRVPI